MAEVSFEFEGWDVESLRLSIFCQVDRDTYGPGGLWKMVTGEEPDSIDSRPKEGITREVGTNGRNNLLLTIQNGRIDWMLQPIVDPNREPPTVPILQSLEEALPIFQGAIHCSLESIPIVHRLAFAPVLIEKVSDLTKGFAELSEYLPRLDLDTLESADFVYQVNRRRRSKSAPRAQINRIAKWSIGEVGGVLFRVTPSGQPVIQNTKFTVVRKLELDINTTPQTSVMSKDEIPSLFDELVSLSQEIAVKGDIS